jgi:hypothetical protein
MNAILMRISLLAPPTGLARLLPAIFPTLKRGANDRCASGAIETGTSVVNKIDSCDCPWGARAGASGGTGDLPRGRDYHL